MNAIQLLRDELDLSATITLKLIDDMKDAPLTAPTKNGGNHPLWVMGHMAYVEGQIQQLITEQLNPLEKWKNIFAGGTEPTSSAADYPTLEEARSAFITRRAATLQLLENITEADLDRPTKCPPENAYAIGTVGKCLFILVANTLTHRGQVADARRTLGRKRLGP